MDMNTRERIHNKDGQDRSLGSLPLLKLRRSLQWLILLISMMSMLMSCGTWRLPQSYANFNLEVGTPEYFDLIAHIHYQRGEYERAIAYYNILIEEFSPRAEAYDTELAWATYEIGFCHYKQKRYEDAYAQYQKVIADYRDLGAVILARKQLRALEEDFPEIFESTISS